MSSNDEFLKPGIPKNKTNQHSRIPSRQISISNLKRSISRSSSISSLKSLLSLHSNEKNNDQIKRKKTPLFNDLGIKRKKIFRLFNNKPNNVNSYNIEPSINNDALNNDTIMTNNNENPITIPNNSIRNKKTYRRKPPINNLEIDKTNKNIQNFEALEKKKLNYNDSLNIEIESNSIHRIIEEDEEDEEEEFQKIIPPSKSTFSFNLSTENNNNKLKKRIVTSRGYYNLSKFTDDQTDDDNIITPKSVSTITTTPLSMTGSLKLNTNDIIMDEIPINEQTNNNDDDDGFLNYYHNTIELYHTQDPKSFLQNYYYKQDNVDTITKKLSMANLNDNLKFNKPIQKEKLTIMNIPEIVERILSFVEDDIILPVEIAPIKRKPINFENLNGNTFKQPKGNYKYNELLLTNYFNNDNQEKTTKHSIYKNDPLLSIKNIKMINKTIYNCLFVNRLWYSISKKIIFNKLFFINDENFQKLIQKLRQEDENDENFKELFKNSSTRIFLLRKLKHVTQDQINLLANYLIYNGNKLEWIEMYICPSIYPPLSLFTSYSNFGREPSKLKKLILAGSNSKKINNFFLKIMSINSPLLEKLDLRSCEWFDDQGIIEISKNCLNLKYLNIGRFKNKNLITDNSLLRISQNCLNLETLGCAGCCITDSTLYSLSINQSKSLKKLSINNCEKISNESISIIFNEKRFYSLQVLEIRNLINIKDFLPIIKYKHYLKTEKNLGFLLENCDFLEKLYKFQQFEYNLKLSKNFLNNLQKWCNDNNDDDLSLEKFIEIKKKEMIKKGLL